MKNKIKKLLFSGILSLVLVFAVAFASLSVLRTNDHANALGTGTPHYFTGEYGDLEYSFEDGTTLEVVKSTLSQHLSTTQNAEIVVDALFYNNLEIENYTDTVDAFGTTTGDRITYHIYKNLIKFTPVVKYQDGANLVDNEWWLPASNDTTGLGYQVTVEYKVFSNTGINNLVLIPTYDATVFSIASVTPNNTTALGEAEVTGVVGNPTVKKVAWDSETTFSGYSQNNEEVVLLTVVFNVNKAVDGNYVFGLQLQDGATYNDKSTAHVFEAGKTGEQEAVAISLALSATPENVVRIKTLLPAQIKIGYNTWDNGDTWYGIYYKGTAVEVNKVGALTEVLYSGDEVEYTDEVVELYATDKTSVEYTYNGTATPVVTWYNRTIDGNEYVWTEMENAPITPGVYRVGISAPAHGKYFAVAETYREVTILKSTVTINIDNKESVYGNALAQLTHSTVVNGIGIPAETLNVQLATNPASISNVGSYPIVATYYNPNEDLFTVLVNNGTYTITKRPITITALDQSAKYSGEEPEVDQTQYTVTGVNSITGVVITKAAGVNVGTYTLTPSLNNANYDPTYVPAKFTITTVGKDADYILSFFAGDEVTYDAQPHDLLIVGTLPEWLQGEGVVTVSNNSQTNAGQYAIGIQVNLDEQTANNWTSGTQSFTLSVEYGVINKAPLTVTAVSKTHEYGQNPATLTSTFVGLQGNDTVTVSYTVLNSNENAITLSSTTTVGTYTIVPSVTNGNYVVTPVNGTYTVTKTNPVITITFKDNVTEFEYNQKIDYTVSVKVAGSELSSDSYTVKTGENTLTPTTLLNVDNYTLTVNVPAGTNYNAGSKTANFTIVAVELGEPGLSYENGRVTWTAPTKDDNDKNLVGEVTFTYKINNETQSGNSYTAGSTAALTLTVIPSNENYAPIELELKDVYQVSFASENVTDFGGLTGLPATPQFIFDECFVVAPQANPTRTGYTFKAWDPTLTTAITANTTIYATWDIIQYTITVVYPVNATTTETATGKVNHGTTITTSVANLCATIGKKDTTPAQTYNLAGLKYDFKETWNYKVTGTEEVLATGLGSSSDPVTALGNYTFTAEYTTTPLPYYLSYKYSYDGETSYPSSGAEPTEILFGTTITYATLPNLKWFRFEGWFTNPERTVLAPETMPAGNLTVYGSYVFDIGTGDVNANKEVTTNDITLYRQWIVGGYSMTELKTDDVVLETAIEETEYSTGTRYFLYRVADVNGDHSLDIRDVSTIRMTIATGYGWEDENGYNVSGHEVIRNEKVSELDDISTAVQRGHKVTLAADITDANGQLDLSYAGNVTLDLGGHTLTVAKVDLRISNRGTLTIKNGTIVTTQGITLYAPYGNVVLEDVDCWDDQGLVNLGAGSHSLHLFGVVEFYKGTNTAVAEPTPAAVNVAQDTHVVVEAAAELVVEKLVVAVVDKTAQVTAQAFEVPATVTAEQTITVESKSVEVDVNEITVVGHVESNDKIKTREDLVAAGQNGGIYTLDADLSFSGKANRVYFYKDTVLNLNGHTITSTNEIPLVVDNGGKLTINGEGNVNGREACVIAFNGSELVVNGGTFTCTDNFVLGTNGSTGKGDNKITVNGGVFNGGIISAGYVACGIYVANNDTVVVNGGTFNVTNGVGILARSGNTTVKNGVVFNVTGNGTTGKVGDSAVTVPAGAVLVVDLAADYPGGDPTLTNNTTYKVAYVVGSEADINAVKANTETIVLGKDITCEDDIVANNTIFTFDLNGHNVTFHNGAGFTANYTGKLTVKGNGNVTTSEVCLFATRGSELVVNGGTYTSTNNFVIGTNGSADRAGSTITINGGTFNGSMTEAGRAEGYTACGIYVANNDTVVVNAGTFNIANGVGILARSGNTTVANGVVLNVTGNGTLGKVGDSKVTVPAGAALVLDLAANYPGGDPTLTNNTTYKVAYVVATEAELREALEVGGYVVLTNDISVTGDDRLTITVDTNLDLNGHTLKSADGLEPTNWATLWVNNGAVANISNGTIGSCYDSDGTTDAPYGIYVGLKNVSSGTVNLRNVNVYGGVTSIQVTSGEANIYSGSFKASPYLNAYEYTLNCFDANYQNGTARFNVYGGQFENFNPADCAAEGEHTNFVAEGYEVTSEVVGENTVYTVQAIVE